MTTKRKTQKAASGKPDPTRQTVTELLKDVRGVPLWVRFWLERYASGDACAIEPHGLDDDPTTQAIARLVYDVLDSPSQSTGTGLSEREFPAEARDFVQEWLYRITADGLSHTTVWNNADLAVGALPTILDCEGLRTDASPIFTLLRQSINALTTKRERRAFLRDADEDDAEPEKKSETNWAAAFKLSRVLADPRTPAKTRDEIESALREFANAAEVQVTHPALARRAFQLMCDARPKGKVRACGLARSELLALLDEAPESEEGGAK